MRRLNSSARPDMFVLGFQEIVPLTAQQIVQTDPEKRYAASPLRLRIDLTLIQASLGSQDPGHFGSPWKQEE